MIYLALIIYTVGLYLTRNLDSQSNNLQLFTGLFVVAFIIGVIIVIYQKKKMNYYWLKKPIKDTSLTLYLSFLFLLIPLTNVFQQKLNNGWSKIILVLGSVFLEELFFHSYLFNYFQTKNNWSVKKNILLVNGIFAASHLVNWLQGAQLGYTLLQIGFAGMIGLGLSMIMLKQHSIVIPVILHFFINITAISSIVLYNLISYSVVAIGCIVVFLSIRLPETINYNKGEDNGNIY